MTGTLIKRKLTMGEVYYTTIYFYDEEGRRHQKREPTGLLVKGNKTRAEELLRKRLAEAEAEEKRKQEAQANRNVLLFSDWISQWLKEAKRRVENNTYRQYDDIARLHILPYFDNMGVTLGDITEEILQEYVDEKQDKGRKDGKGGLSPAAIRHHVNILNQSLKKAMHDGRISVNPCEGLILPKKQRRTPTYYTAEQMQRALDVIYGEPIYPVVYFAMTFGLRRSEVLGMKWDCVCYYTDTFHIRHTVTQDWVIEGKDRTKNASSNRGLPLTGDAKELLLSLKASEAENRRLFGREYIESPYIFKWPNGKPFTPDYVSHRFSDLLQKHGLPHIHFHDLRHSCASLLLAKGHSTKLVSEWLGHSDYNTTANIYSHVNMGQKRDLMDTMGGSLKAKVLPQGVTTG